MKVIITGATGMVGKGILLECLDHKDITEVLSISRRSLDLTHPKLKELIHKDFADFSQVKDDLQGYDACFASMGVSSAGMNEEQFTHFTYDFTLALANELYAINPQMTFNYVSGQGTDSTEKGKVMWARVKGKTENDIFKMGFKQSFAFRPGAIIPRRGVRSSSKLYRVLIFSFMWLLLLMKRMAPTKVIDTVQIGLAMINIVSRGYEKKIIDPVDVLILAK